MLETTSQAMGIRALVLVTVGLYVASWIAGSRTGKMDDTGDAITREEAALAAV
jgi:hypothetical protein